MATFQENSKTYNNVITIESSCQRISSAHFNKQINRDSDFWIKLIKMMLR